MCAVRGWGGESRNMIAGLYDLEETIGEGHYAVVKLARWEGIACNRRALNIVFRSSKYNSS
jgi:hypothetical protein